mmetsp:Transcript_28732/g.73737  ORF Transcript_28732/g.73737 Transcript_28732/m.73737 type:complete len:364 (-) Transcript_28732:270-1361(-)
MEVGVAVAVRRIGGAGGGSGRAAVSLCEACDHVGVEHSVSSGRGRHREASGRRSRPVARHYASAATTTATVVRVAFLVVATEELEQPYEERVVRGVLGGEAVEDEERQQRQPEQHEEGHGGQQRERPCNGAHRVEVECDRVDRDPRLGMWVAHLEVVIDDGEEDDAGSTDSTKDHAGHHQPHPQVRQLRRRHCRVSRAVRQVGHTPRQDRLQRLVHHPDGEPGGGGEKAGDISRNGERVEHERWPVQRVRCEPSLRADHGQREQDREDVESGGVVPADDSGHLQAALWDSLDEGLHEKAGMRVVLALEQRPQRIRIVRGQLESGCRLEASLMQQLVHVREVEGLDEREDGHQLAEGQRERERN